jgi:hypothetical protein
MALKFGEADPRDYRRSSGGGIYDAKGYAARPGTGPAGESCRTCKHLYRHEMANTYFKCSLMRRIWTRGPGSDIRAKSPACARWEIKDENNPDQS